MDPVILIFACIAAFFIFKLYTTLGDNSGEGDSKSDNVSDLDALRRTLTGGLKKADAPAGKEDKTTEKSFTDNVVPLTVRKTSDEAKPLLEADPNFDEAAFLEGAKYAYEMIVEAFAKGETKDIKDYVGKNVLSSLKAAIEQRQTDNQTIDMKFVGIESAKIVSASISEDKMTAVTDFVSDQVRVTKDGEGNVVDGDPNRIDLVRDRWTFTRKRNNNDPNWLLVATGSAT